MKSNVKKLAAIMFCGAMLSMTACGEKSDDNAVEGSYRIVKLVDMTGEVTYQRADKSQEAYLNMNFENGDKVSTGQASSADISLDDDKQLAMGADTSITMVAEGDKKNSRTIITLEQGEITNVIDGKLSSGSLYEIETSNATIGVHGTTFYVKSEGKETIVYCDDGVVEVEAGDTTKELESGQAVKVEEAAVTSISSEELKNEMSPEMMEELPVLDAIVGESSGDGAGTSGPVTDPDAHEGDTLPNGAVLEADGYYWQRNDDGSWVKYGADGNVVEVKGYSSGLNGERQYILYKYTTDAQGFSYAYQEDVYDLDTDALVASYTDHYDFVEERPIDASDPTGVVRKLWYTHYFEEDKGDGDIFVSDTQEMTIHVWDDGGWTISGGGWQ